MKRITPTTLAALLFLLALLISVVLMYRAATGRLSVYWLDQNMTSLSLTVPFAVYILLKQRTRHIRMLIAKLKLFFGAVKFIWNNKNA